MCLLLVALIMIEAILFNLCMLKEINRINLDRKRLAVKKPIEVAKFTFLVSYDSGISICY